MSNPMKPEQPKRTRRKVFVEARKTRGVSMFLRGVPREVREHFKAYCARRGTSMTEVLLEDILQHLADDQKPVT